MISTVYRLLLLVAVALLAPVHHRNLTGAPERATAALRHLRGAAAALAVTILADLAVHYADSPIRTAVLNPFVALERPRVCSAAAW